MAVTKKRQTKTPTLIILFISNIPNMTQMDRQTHQGMDLPTDKKVSKINYCLIENKQCVKCECVSRGKENKMTSKRFVVSTS